MATPGRLETSREAILDILRRRSGVSVEDLAQALGLAGATVRRHLDVLLRDGYITVTQVRGGAGRPRYAFSLTEAGAELFPHHYVRLTRRLLDEIAALQPADTAGRRGAELAGLVFDKMAERLAREYAPRVEGASLEARAHAAASLLAEEGLDFEVERHADGVRLLGHGCPCRRFAVAGACDHDQRLLEATLGVPVRPLPPSDVPTQFSSGYLADAPEVAFAARATSDAAPATARRS